MLLDRKNIYTQASIRVRERMASKVTKDLNKILDKNRTDDYREFIKLTQTVPNWKTYLTEKQLEVVDLFLKILNCAAVDSQLKLNEGITYTRLFGNRSHKNERGAFGALEQASKKIKKIQAKKTSVK